MDCNKIKNTIPAYIIYLIYLNKLHNSNTFKYALQRQQKMGEGQKLDHSLITKCLCENKI